jgi:hypothetical protein
VALQFPVSAPAVLFKLFVTIVLALLVSFLSCCNKFSNCWTDLPYLTLEIECPLDQLHGKSGVRMQLQYFELSQPGITRPLALANHGQR